MLQRMRNYLFVTTLENEIYLITRHDYAGYNNLALYFVYQLDKTTEQFKVIGQIETKHDLDFDATPYVHSPIILIAYGVAFGKLAIFGSKQRLNSLQLRQLFNQYKKDIDSGKIDIGYVFS